MTCGPFYLLCHVSSPGYFWGGTWNVSDRQLSPQPARLLHLGQHLAEAELALQQGQSHMQRSGLEHSCIQLLAEAGPFPTQLARTMREALSALLSQSSTTRCLCLCVSGSNEGFI